MTKLNAISRGVLARLFPLWWLWLNRALVHDEENPQVWVRLWADGRHATAKKRAPRNDEIIHAAAKGEFWREYWSSITVKRSDVDIKRMAKADAAFYAVDLALKAGIGLLVGWTIWA